MLVEKLGRPSSCSREPWADAMGTTMTTITTMGPPLAVAVRWWASRNRTRPCSLPSSLVICLWTIVSPWLGVSLILAYVDSYRVFIQETSTPRRDDRPQPLCGFRYSAF